MVFTIPLRSSANAIAISLMLSSYGLSKTASLRSRIKCMLHLMRDLNDAVLDNPYDESIKEIAMAFAELLRGIVKTIDRRGLKSLFLRKHLVDVARFYKRISRAGQFSVAASK